jgi:probable non-F420 flavinoid oxidoreductase
MATIGYHASHEQHAPSALLRDVQRAEAAGFASASSSDHFSPWSERQGHAGFAWSWLGAAMQATSLPMGVVNAPGQRYHPAIIAQAIATLGELFPGRFWVALGSGEASNEHITGARWPAKAARNERLAECVGVIRALLAGEEVSVDGHVRVDRARLWTTTAEPPPLYGAALCIETAAWCASWADGLITVAVPPDRLRALIDAFRANGGEGKPVLVQAKVAWAETDDEAVAGAFDQWRTNVFDSALMADLERVEQFEIAARHVRPEDVRSSVFTSSDLSAHVDHLAALVDCGVDQVLVHHVPKPQEAFIEAYATDVLPQLAGDRGA